MRALTEGNDIIASLNPAFERYNENQLTTVKLPGANQEVGLAIGPLRTSPVLTLYALEIIISQFNKLENNRYFDTESQTSFEVDHITQVG